MNGELEGKVAVITGAASGIGLATSRLFVEQGAKVVLADINREAGHSAAASLGESAAFIPVDVTRPDDIQAAIELALTRFGSLDVMFNNAGIPGTASGLFADDDLGDFHRVMEVNLLGVMIGCQLAARSMAACGNGSIINTGSLGGTLPGLGVTSYRAAKAAVNHFTKCIAIEYAAHGVRVNCINPSGIPTEMSSLPIEGMTREAVDETNRKMSDIMMKGQPLKRSGSVQDVANAALYFASERSAYVTGVALAVDGGHGAGDATNYLELMLRARDDTVRSLRPTAEPPCSEPKV